MSQPTDRPLRNGLFAAALLAATFAVPAWAAGQSASSHNGAGSTSVPESKTQSEELNGHAKSGNDVKPQGSGGQTSSMPSSKSQRSLLKENKNMSHQGSKHKKTMHKQSGSGASSNN